MNFYLVDDDPDILAMLSRVLEEAGHRVEASPSSLQALKQIPMSRPDCVITDIMMPEMDGFETTQHIRALSHFDNLPIIALTAKAMLGDREKCIEAGASDYITKPVDLDQLLSLLRVWLYR
jgi:CheY-like chemotaxis protein